MNKSKLMFLTLLSLTSASAISLISATVAWIVDANNIDMSQTAGYTQGAYFARGSGTEEDPYILNAPIHLYNLAWLQEMGKFNTANDDGTIDTVYFKMEADLNMTGTPYEKLPPIGTSTYPFLGNFDGDGYTISGLKTCNELGTGENEIVRKPSAVTTLNNVNILGVFGVVGSYNGSPSDASYSSSANEIKNLKIKDYTIASSSSNLLCGAVAGYVNGAITDVAVSNADNGITFDIADGTSTLGSYSNISDYGLVGYATSDYKKDIGDETVNIYNTHVDQEETAYVFAGSDEGWGGTISMMEIYKRLAQYETENGNLSELGFPKNKVKTKTTTTTDGGTPVETYEYYDDIGSTVKQWSDDDYPLRGKVVFNTTAERYLWGAIKDTRTSYEEISVTKTTGDTYTYISQNTTSNPYYMSITASGTSYSIGRTQSTDARAKFFADSNGLLYTVINNANVYLYTTSVPTSDNGTVTLYAGTGSPQSSRYYVKPYGNYLRLYNYTGTTVQTRGYVRYTSTYSPYFQVRGSNSGYAKYGTDTDTETTTETTYQNDNHYAVEKYGKTYLPLDVYDSDTIPEKDQTSFWNDRSLVPTEQNVGEYCPIPSNTAYIIGGTVDHTLSDTYGSGYRFKKFTNYQPFQRTMGNQTTYDSSLLQVITRTPDTNGFTFIEDEYNKNKTLATGMSAGYTYLDHIPEQNRVRHSYTDLGLERYEDSRTALDNICSQNTSSWYMRYNGQDVSLDNIITADSVVLNKHYYTDYEFPESTIDFRIADRGIINMFSSGFRAVSEGEECYGFCSLYQIFRDSSQNITDIKRIKEIYSSENDDSIVYKYFTSTTSSDEENRYFKYTTVVDPTTNLVTEERYDEYASLPDGYSLKFDLDWLENPGFTQCHSACYYFEWPVSPGEYAIGGIPGGKKSAYMCYLDVGASSKKSKRTSVFVKYTIDSKEYTIPLGVYFISDLDEELTTNKTLCLKLKSGFDGEVTVSGTSTLTELSRYDDYLELNFKEYDMIVKKAGEDPPIEVVANSTISQTVERLTIIDHLNDNSETSFVITETRTSVDGGTETVERESIMINAAGVESEYTNTTLDPHDNENITDVLFELWFYYVDDNTIDITVGFTKKLDESYSEDEVYYLVENITVDIDSTSDLVINIVALDEEGTYGLVVNGDVVAEIGTIDISAA